jgi:hypothetical protein
MCKITQCTVCGKPLLSVVTISGRTEGKCISCDDPRCDRRNEMRAMGKSMATNMLAHRKLSAVLIGAAIGFAATAWEAQAQPASLPDLTLSMERAPTRPVPKGVGYEVQIMVANTLPRCPRIRPVPPVVPRADPSIPVPPIGSPQVVTGCGADVQQAELEFSTTIPSHQRIGLIQIHPPLNISCTVPSPFGSVEICVIGPLTRGGSWMITMSYPSLVPLGGSTPPSLATGGSTAYAARIDYLNKITERNEANNSGQVVINYQAN